MNNLSVVMRNAFTFSTLKKVACVMVAMLSIAILTSCSSEELNHHPAAASDLMGTMNESNGLGWATVDVEASAKDINGDPISANADVRYEAEKEVFVQYEEELGLPVTATGDGTTFTINDGNVITRTESHSASKGVTLNVAGGEWKNGTLGERIDEETQIRQICYAHISDQAFASADLPESFSKEWRGEKVSVIEYHRVWVKPATPVYEPQYRLRSEFVEVDRGNVYFNIYAEKSLDNGQTWTEMDRYIDFNACQFGTWKPNVSGSLLVSSYDFTSEDTKVEMTKDAPLLNQGDSKLWGKKNTIFDEYRWKSLFKAPADANGKTERDVSGAQIVKGSEPIWKNPETGKEMSLSFTAEARTTTNEVDKTTGVYTRIVEIVVNGKVVATQPGSVQLEIG